MLIHWKSYESIYQKLYTSGKLFCLFSVVYLIMNTTYIYWKVLTTIYIYIYLSTQNTLINPYKNILLHTPINTYTSIYIYVLSNNICLKKIL